MNAQKKAIENEKSMYIPYTLHNKRKNNHTNFYVSFNSFSIAQCVSDSGHYNFVSMFVVPCCCCYVMCFFFFLFLLLLNTLLKQHNWNTSFSCIFRLFGFGHIMSMYYRCGGKEIDRPISIWFKFYSEHCSIAYFRYSIHFVCACAVIVWPDYIVNKFCGRLKRSSSSWH